ncbi:ankyrin-1-like, partial [Copidosoma floridanum]|uniref:ankyrin-1-like n=1 Tax=Copidosoma floridanum TaxID=29053 RepID=UPI000C6FA856
MFSRHIIRNESTVVMERLLKDGYDIYARDFQVNTPLLIAVACNNADIVRFLLDKKKSVSKAIIEMLIDSGVHVNIADRWGDMPLTYVVQRNNTPVAIMLIDAGALVNIKNKKVLSPLIYTVKNNNISLASILIKSGALINDADKYDNIPLIHAKFLDRCLVILKKDIKPYYETTNKEMFSRHIIRNESTVVMERLLKDGYDINARDFQVNTPLLIAVACNNADIVRFLLDKKVRINLSNHNGNTPLWIALKKSVSKAIIEMLIDSGVHVNIADRWGDMPLTYVVQRNNTPVAIMLIDAGALVNIKNKKVLSPLIYTVKNNNISLASILIKSGALINDADKYDNIPLIHAVRNMYITNHQGKTCFYYFIEYQYSIHPGMKKVLNKGPMTYQFPNVPVYFLTTNVKEQLDESLYKREMLSKAIIEMLIDSGVHVNIADRWGDMPLTYVVQRNNTPVAIMLIDAGALVNIKNKKVLSPLIYTVKNNNISLASILIKSGALINDADKYDNIPLIHA